MIKSRETIAEEELNRYWAAYRSQANIDFTKPMMAWIETTVTITPCDGSEPLTKVTRELVDLNKITQR